MVLVERKKEDEVEVSDKRKKTKTGWRFPAAEAEEPPSFAAITEEEDKFHDLREREERVLERERGKRQRERSKLILNPRNREPKKIDDRR